MELRVTVGPADADFVGTNDLAIQSAVDFVARRGGGTVDLRPGTYLLSNSVRLRGHVALTGAGDDTVLRKQPSATVALTEDTDWYDKRVTVADPTPFKVGGGILLHGRCPHSGAEQITIHTVLGIRGHTLRLDTAARGLDSPAHVGNYWVSGGATASTLFSMITANWSDHLRVTHLRLDGNRAHNSHLSGNYGGALYFQDCERVLLRDVTVDDMDSDGLSFQVVHHLLVESCRFTNCAQGVHAGSGSQRPVIRQNVIRHCDRHGLSWCWGVKYGVAEGNIIEDCPTGISIGHRDTHNALRHNTIRRCVEGLVYRDDPPEQAAHENLIEDNLFEDIGHPEQPGYAIDLSAPVHGNVLRGNRIVAHQPGALRAAIRLGPTAGETVLENNTIEGVPALVEDLRG